MRILFVIQHLQRAGAERQLVNLAQGLARRGHAVRVAVFRRCEGLEDELAAGGVEVVGLRRAFKLDLAGLVRSLARAAREHRAEVVHSYLGAANIVAALARPFLCGARLVMGVRASDMDLTRYGLLSRLQYRVEPLLARAAHMIIANSEAGARHAALAGFPEDRLRVAHNGIDTELFRPDPARGAALRREWGAGDGDVLVGMAGRLDPMKGHDVFLRAAGLLAPHDPRLRFVVVGGAEGPEGDGLRALARDLGLSARVVFAGRREDMAAAMNALDVFCSASRYGEGFSNVLAEAMASGLACVATDVGDSALILGDAGALARPDDPASLAGALGRVLARLRAGEDVGEALRRRVTERFGIERLTEQTEGLLVEALRDRNRT